MVQNKLQYTAEVIYERADASQLFMGLKSFSGEKEYPQIPPKVEYSLSDRGKSLMDVLDLLCVWGEKNRE